MAKGKFKVVAASSKKVAALIGAVNKKGEGGSTVYWVLAEGSHYIGTRHWYLRLPALDSVMTAALAGVGLTEPGKAWHYGKIIEAPNVMNLVNEHSLGQERPASDTRLFIDSLDSDYPVLRLLDSNKGYYAVDNEYFQAISALYPFSPLSVRNDVVVFGEMQAIILPYRIGNTQTGDQVERYMKGRLAIRFEKQKAK